MIFTKFRKYIPFILISILSTAACKKSKTAKPDENPNADVYVAGYVLTSGGRTVATLWKNGVATRLTDSTINSLASNIVINGNNVYVTGSVDEQAVYWKNGTITKLGLYPWGSAASAVTVNGNDVYIVGYTTTMRGEAIATYWKNNLPTRIATDTTLSTYGNAIVFNGNDMYVAGYSNSERADLVYFAIYWKNGVATKLDELSKYYNDAAAITVSNSDLYIVGHTVDTTNITIYKGKAALWKNGVLEILSSNANESEANAIALNGNDIYVGGMTDNNATYWKTGVATVLANGTPLKPSYISSIATNGDDIYMAGTSSGTATYWKNNVPVKLSANGICNAIVVTPL